MQKAVWVCHVCRVQTEHTHIHTQQHVEPDQARWNLHWTGVELPEIKSKQKHQKNVECNAN